MAADWFSRLLTQTFEDHYKCADCINEERCEYWGEAYDCFRLSGHNWDEIITQFNKESPSENLKYALAKIKEWDRSARFNHAIGWEIRRLKERSS